MVGRRPLMRCKRDADCNSSTAAKGETRTSEKHERLVQRPGRSRWSYLPLTRTPHKPLTCDFATPWRSLTLRLPRNPALAPKPSAKRPWSLRERLDERDIAELI